VAAERRATALLVAARAAELVGLVGEEDVEAGQAAVAGGDVGLEAELEVLGTSEAFSCCSSVRSRFRIITTLWKRASTGQAFSCRPGFPGRSTTCPPRHFGRGAPG